jgi:YidC/Oxa1 family membrane protein insertase
MDWQKTALLGAIAAVIILLLGEWNTYSENKRPAVDTSTTNVAQAQPAAIPDGAAPVAATGSDLPSAPEDNQTQPAPAATVAAQSQLVSVKTDTLEVLIDTLGGDIVKVALPKHLASLDGTDPFILLNRNNSHLYVAQSGLVGPNGTDTAEGRPTFASSSSEYQLAEGENTLIVDLTLDQNGVQITKRFTFTRGDSLVNLEYLINNQTSSPWAANLFGQIKRDGMVPVTDAGIGVTPFLGAALTTTEENYKKFNFDDLQEKDFKTSINGGWVAMVQHYFLSAWVPDQSQENHFTLRHNAQGHYLLGYTGPRVEVGAGQQGVLKTAFYAGPKDVYRLETLSPYLELTVDYGWLWWIAKPIFYFLHWIERYVGSWGWSIIILTVCIKLAFFQLSAASYRSMAKMRKVQPLMQDLKDRFGDDRQKMSAELMKLYKKEKINPLGGCLPILVQMPVFIAL